MIIHTARILGFINGYMLKKRVPIVIEVITKEGGRGKIKPRNCEVEDNIINCMSKRFQAMEMITLHSGEVAAEVVIMGQTIVAQKFLNGTYNILPGTEKHTVEMLKQLKSLLKVKELGDIAAMATR